MALDPDDAVIIRVVRTNDTEEVITRIEYYPKSGESEPHVIRARPGHENKMVVRAAELLMAARQHYENNRAQE